MSTETPWKVQDQLPIVFTTESVPAVRHPLEEVNKFAENWRKASSHVEPVKEKYEFEDPLGATFDEDKNVAKLDLDIVMDVKPRAHSLDNTLEIKKTDRSGFDIELPDFKPWRDKRAEIIKWSKPKELSNDPLEQMRAKLQRLQETGHINEKRGTKSDISQDIFNTRENMINAWNKENRVEAFKQVVQIPKLIQLIKRDSTDFPYYWLQAIDVLDLFGKLVYDRLYDKTNEARNKAGQAELPSNFNSNHVPQTTKDVTMHWFLKVAEISDLIPRFYVETAMIGCLRFLDSDNVKVNLERLSSMCSQFPNDMFTMYSRMYISRISMYIDASDRTPHWRVLHDHMQSQKDVMEEKFAKVADEMTIRKRELKKIALSWIVQCVSHGSHTVEDLAPLWIYCRKVNIDERTFLHVSACVSGLPSKYLAMHSRRMLDSIFTLKEHFERPLTELGARFSQYPPLEEDRSFVKKSVWRRIADISDFASFVNCCAEWTPFIAKNFPASDISKVLDLAVMRLKMDEQTRDPKNCDVLLKLVSAFIDHNPDDQYCLEVVTDKNFVRMLDLIEEGSDAASDCARIVLESFVKQFKRSTIQNYLSALMIIEQCAIICKKSGLENNDSTKLDEKLAARALSLIDFKSRSDKMQSIELIVKARGLMGLRQIVLQQILEILTDFTLHAYSTLSNGAKKAAFMRICVTNMAITVPAVHDPIKRMRISMKIIQISLWINFLPQVEASCVRCVEVMEGLTKFSTCNQMLPLINRYLALLCFVPDLPSQKTFLNEFQQILKLIEINEEAWSKEANGSYLADIFISCLRYLCASRQLIPRAELLAGNSIIYAGNKEFLSHVDNLIDTIMAKLLGLANEPNVAVTILENVVLLFKVNEEVRSTIRGLLKRAVVSTKTSVRLDAAVNDLREMSKTDECVMDVLKRLSLT